MQEHLYTPSTADLRHLFTLGFSETEAARLIHMKDHVAEQTEYREMIEEERRLDFIRWLVEHDRLSK
ncbi:MAG: hypothetical protein JO202_00845 [Ktedonobacteraceae bacterium]|nr:hypothetical protein [Ktedonobacteraceae bacterium]